MIRPRRQRTPLSRDLVLRAAVALADEGGVASLTMRKLAERLGVEAMSLYHHVADKDAIFDGIVDVVFGEIELPASDVPWRAALRGSAVSARAALARHPWAITLMESRPNPGPATLRHHDAVIGCLRAGGFSIADAAHAYSVLDSYLYGFVLQSTNIPIQTPEQVAEVGTAMLGTVPAEEYPHFVEMLVEHAMKPGYSYAAEFEYGLDLVLDAIELIPSRIATK
ncbi:TetR/AcrR family transcriptional regulator [Virgisporangium aurantiacum]|uniref:TetR family transcriptional regulator n=1 Tax=Virgisporangium aurantiacum TaxID=175570 RepID=A0A8J4DZI7_9ACTN|nr:TetR/AcrR family transcriptional regulator [Virgisporangium aurantiacum]GIJ55974.1 TetR family transcriptional regulator [Virgisporangium aurantiacum]